MMIATGEWTFSFSDDIGWDEYDKYSTPSEALEEARKVAADYADEQGMDEDEKAFFLKEGNVFIGQICSFAPEVDADFVIEHIQNEAYEEGGEYVQDYLDPPTWKDAEARKKWNEQIEDLTSRLTSVFHEWAKETNNEPRFYLINDIRSELLSEVDTGND